MQSSPTDTHSLCERWRMTLAQIDQFLQKGVPDEAAARALALSEESERFLSRRPDLAHGDVRQLAAAAQQALIRTRHALAEWTDRACAREVTFRARNADVASYLRGSRTPE